MKAFVYPEMMVHVPLCVNKDPKNVLIVSENAELLAEEIQKHDAIGFEIIGCDLDLLRALKDATYDVVINEMSGDAVVLAHINRVLKEDGQLVTTHPSLDQFDKNSALMQILGNYFKVIMPYNLGTGETAILASKAYHPTADIILQRADMIDNLEYYNCDIHPASFAMPNYIKKQYLGIIKN
jgi:spermidine synthase